jgi:hypothetical protein
MEEMQPRPLYEIGKVLQESKGKIELIPKLLKMIPEPKRAPDSSSRTNI